MQPTEIEMQSKSISIRIEHGAVQEANGQREVGTAPHDARLWLAMDQLITHRPVLVCVVFRVKVDLVDGQYTLFWFQQCF